MKRHEIAILVIGAFCILALWILTPLILPCWAATIDSSKAGTFGDMFGAVNALFSGAALLFVIGALYFQQREITQAAQDSKIQVNLMRISAQLTALPALIESEVSHLKKHHIEDLDGLSIDTATHQTVKRLLDTQWRQTLEEKKASSDPRLGHYHCFINNVEALILYRSDLESLYKELSGKKSA
jgi:hypothetical protein